MPMLKWTLAALFALLLVNQANAQQPTGPPQQNPPGGAANAQNNGTQPSLGVLLIAFFDQDGNGQLNAVELDHAMTSVIGMIRQRVSAEGRGPQQPGAPESEGESRRGPRPVPAPAPSGAGNATG